MIESQAAGPAPEREQLFVFPQSYAQQRLWFLEQLDPESAAYNLPVVLRLRGALDVDALERAFAAIVERHEALRTTFADDGGDPIQVIHPDASVFVPREEIEAGPNQEDEALRRVFEEVNRPFDLQRGPLLRTALLRLDERHHLLVVTLHHIIADGWSIRLLLRELGELYGAFAAGRAPVLPDLPLQYADFSEWQREWLEGEALEQQLEYWKDQLEDAPAFLELPTDHPRPVVQGGRGGHATVFLSSELLEDLKELTRDEGATLFMTLVAAFVVVLSRWSGQQDIVVGTPIANRNRVEIEQLIGFFANTLVLRSDVSGDPSFRQLLRRIRQMTLDAYAHQDLPFEKLVSELNPQRELSHSPLFQVLFAFQNVPRGRFEWPGLTVEGVEIDRQTAKFDLALFMSERKQGLRASLEYNADLFGPETAARMLGHLQTVVEGAVAAPDTAVSRLPLLTAQEFASLRDWNDTAIPDTEYVGCVHELVERQVERTPDAIAVTSGAESLTYAELNARANQLARRLRALGVGRDTPVGFCLGRSLEAVVCVLAILKAGGAYVPLDPAYPSERLAHMLEDAAVPVLVAKTSYLEHLPESSTHVVCVDAEAASLAREEEDNLDRVADADALGYVLFTSGSTGRPKGVAMPHRILWNLVSWQLETWQDPAAARTLQFASLSFDVAFQELFCTWSSGGTLVLIDEDTRRDAEALVRVITERRIERLFLPYVALQHVAEGAVHLDVIPASLREVMTAGEALQATPAIRQFFARLPHCVLRNQYGPTESHVVTEHTLTGHPKDWPALPPIGRPIANARVHLVDRLGAEVPVGVPGELLIGGSVLARGYIGRPDLTAERFVTEPFREGSAARVYRTGDLARYLPDGTIEYLGRLDDQLKVRGYRVEPGEIEAALLSHPDVREAAVAPFENATGERRFAAYTVGVSQPGPDEESLREFLSRLLPDYMIPSSFVPLESMPLSPNRKIDRRRLPEPERQVPEQRAVVPARDETERILVEIWRKLLGIEGEIGVSDDFFDLGGHSLLAVRVFAEIERAFGTKLPLALLFQGSTIEHIAVAIRREQKQNEEWSAVVPLRPTGERPPLFVLPGPDGELLFYRDFLSHLGADQPVYGLLTVGLDGRRRPHTRFEDMAADYVKAIRRFAPEGPYRLAGYCFGGVVAYEVAHQLRQQGQEVVLLALVDSTPFGHRTQTPRLELERTKLRDFLASDTRGKMAWLARRLRGFRIKVSTKVRWSLHDGLLALNLRVPRILWNVEAAGLRAMRRYRTPVSSCRVTLFRAVTGEIASFYRPSFWSRLAEGGVEIRPVLHDGIRHDNIMKNPYATALAAEITIELDRALAEHWVPPVENVS